MALLHRVLFVGVLLLMAASVSAQAPDQPPPMGQPGDNGPPGGPMQGGPMQGGPPGGFMHGGSLPLTMLASQKSVQTDLKLSKDQIKRIQSLDRKMRKTVGEGMRGGPPGMPPGPPGMGPGPHDQKAGSQGTGPKPQDAGGGPHGRGPGGPQGMNAKMESARKDAEKELANILTEKQMARLKQIALQVQGPRALLVPETSQKLQLTKEQQSKIKGLTRKDEKKLVAILTEQQRTKWKEMIGPPFHGKISPQHDMPPRNRPHEIMNQP